MNSVRLMLAVTLLLGSAPRGRSEGLSGPVPTGAPAAPLPPGGVTLVDCYDTTVAHLERICEHYRRVKAAELSRLRDIAYADAYENIQSVMPILDPIDRGLLTRPITDPDEITPHKLAVEKVETEITNMVELAARLLNEIEGTVLPPPPVQVAVEPPPVVDPASAADPPVPVETAGSEASTEMADLPEPEEVNALEELARETETRRAVDVSGAMRRILAAPRELSRRELEGRSLVSSQLENQDFRIQKSEYGFGRSAMEHGWEQMKWMFVDTWYTIGPFPNPQRVNLNTKFPPETTVDLNASYPGKDGRRVKWEFLQTNTARVPPHHEEEYAIYYAYTELWFEEEADLWIAIGSDDKSHIWINNLPVWISGDKLKDWRINEGFRKVYFRKGRNRILLRLENGHFGAHFSFGVEVLPGGLPGS